MVDHRCLIIVKGVLRTAVIVEETNMYYKVELTDGSRKKLRKSAVATEIASNALVTGRRMREDHQQEMLKL